MRDWSIELHIAHTETGELLPANCFEKVTYHLHETFGKRAKQNKNKPPFRVEEEGWGEFDMQIAPVQVGKGELDVILHDLNFREERYESRHEVVSFASGGRGKAWVLHRAKKRSWDIRSTTLT